MTKIKKCKKCNTVKTLTEFGKKKHTKDGINYTCKTCRASDSLKYRRTKKGIITAIYCHQKQNSKKRGHTPPTYTKKELEEWSFSQCEFHRLYDNWKRLDFQTEYTPSIDRKDDYIGYTIANIQLITWKENNKKSHKDRKYGINNKHNSAVTMYSKEGNFIDKYHSMKEASRQTGISHASIHLACNGDNNFACGFLWSLADIGEHHEK